MYLIYLNNSLPLPILLTSDNKYYSNKIRNHYLKSKKAEQYAKSSPFKYLKIFLVYHT